MAKMWPNIGKIMYNYIDYTIKKLHIEMSRNKLFSKQGNVKQGSYSYIHWHYFSTPNDTHSMYISYKHTIHIRI